MLIKVTQEGGDCFGPEDEKSKLFFQFLGKETLSAKQLNQLLEEKIEIRFDFSDKIASSNIKVEEHFGEGIVWYSRYSRHWFGKLLKKGKIMDLFCGKEFKGRSKSELLSNMFYNTAALRKDE